jgi:hypothetical protein
MLNALYDALADGSFSESLKKKEARQTLAKTIKMVVAAWR